MGRHRIPVVIALDDLIGQLEVKPTKLRQARALILEALDPKPAEAAAKKGTRPADSSGALAGRLVEIIAEAGADGISPADVVEQSKAPRLHARLALKELQADGQIVSTGATLSKRYRIAKKGGKK